MMNRLIKITTLFFILILSAAPLFAQTTERLEKDIRIAEGILAELFDANNTEFNLRGGNVRGVTGSYIPEYGAHFRISSNISTEAVRVNVTGHAQIERAEEPDPEEITEKNKTFVEDRFMEYFKTYASLLRGIPGDEVIRLTFGVRPPVRPGVIFLPDSEKRHQNLPSMTAWASVSDIQDYSNGSLSESVFEDRIRIQDLTKQETEKDQEVFSSILETALNQAGTEHIRIRRSPEAEYLPDFGVSYHIHASLRKWNLFGAASDMEQFNIQMDTLAKDLSDLLENVGKSLTPMAVRIDSMFNPEKYDSSTDSVVQAYQDSLRRSTHSLRRDLEEQNLSDEDVREEMDKIHTELKQTVMEYGTTLRSLENDEMLMITIHWAGRHPSLPERSELRIRKSELINGAEPEIIRIERK